MITSIINDAVFAVAIPSTDDLWHIETSYKNLLRSQRINPDDLLCDMSHAEDIAYVHTNQSRPVQIVLAKNWLDYVRKFNVKQWATLEVMVGTAQGDIQYDVNHSPNDAGKNLAKRLSSVFKLNTNIAIEMTQLSHESQYQLAI